MQNEKTAKAEQEKIFQARLDKFKDYPKIDQFKTEALETSKLFSQQLNDLCQKIAQSEPLCEITSSLIDEASNIRIEFENANENISEFISWQDSE